MNSLFDFITHIKTVEYLMAIGAIVLYLIYWEALKPKPFKTLVEAGRDDVDHMRKTGYRNTLKTVGQVAAAPFIGLAYIIALPFTFAYALASMIANQALTLLSREASFGWRPIEAYLSGRKKKKKEADSAGKDEKL